MVRRKKNTTKPSLNEELRNRFYRWCDKDPTAIFVMERVRLTVFQMLMDRGFHVDPELLNDIDEDRVDPYDKCCFEFDRVENCSMIASNVLDDTKIAVFICFWDFNKKLSVDAAKNIVIEIKKNLYGRSIIVSNNMSSSASTHIVDQRSNGIWIESFAFDELMWNLLRNELQPDSVHILAQEERNEVIDRYGGDAEKLRDILINDPLSRYYGLLENDIIMCTSPIYVGYQRCAYKPGRDKIFNSKTFHQTIESL
jgi:DNA-directed RNA polymerase subunit H (RpoH/RPB5)